MSTEGGAAQEQKKKKKQGKRGATVEIPINAEEAEEKAEEIRRAELAKKKLMEMMPRLQQKSLSVSSIFVTGNKVTQDDVIERILSPIRSAGTLGQILHEIGEAKYALRSLGIFKNVDILLDDGPGDTVKIAVTLEEKSRIVLSTNTSFGTNEGTGMVTARLRNALGRAEELEGNVSYGTATTTLYELKFTKPILTRLGEMLTVSVSKQQRNSRPTSSVSEKLRGLLVRYSFPSQYAIHDVAYEGVWRDIHVLNNASWPVRENAGPSFKSSLHHAMTIDTRDDPIFPTQGGMVRLSQEVAGLAGDVKFVKGELISSWAQTFTSQLSSSVSFNAGLLYPVGSVGFRKPGSVINDRFFLGGAVSLRGFRTHGVGPRADRLETEGPQEHKETDALGGDMYWAAGLHVYGKVHPRWRVYTQAFVNAGSLTTYKPNTGVISHMADLVRTTRTTVGAGLVFRTAVGRIELNYCQPILTHPGDRARPGLQLGVGMNFL